MVVLDSRSPKGTLKLLHSVLTSLGPKEQHPASSCSLAAYPHWAGPRVPRAGKELLRKKMGTTVDILNILVTKGSIKMGALCGGVHKEHKLL